MLRACISLIHASELRHASANAQNRIGPTPETAQALRGSEHSWATFQRRAPCAALAATGAQAVAEQGHTGNSIEQADDASGWRSPWGGGADVDQVAASCHAGHSIQPNYCAEPRRAATWPTGAPGQVPSDPDRAVSFAWETPTGDQGDQQAVRCPGCSSSRRRPIRYYRMVPTDLPENHDISRQKETYCRTKRILPMAPPMRSGGDLRTRQRPQAEAGQDGSTCARNAIRLELGCIRQTTIGHSWQHDNHLGGSQTANFLVCRGRGSCGSTGRIAQP